jgi:hypothetical protein
MFKILLAALVGTVVCVLWGAVSWMVLQWHNSSLNKFGDEAAVGKVIKAETAMTLKLKGQTSGVFMLPSVPSANERIPSEESKARSQAALKARDDGPYVYAIIRPGEKPRGMGLNLAFAAARSFAACLIMAFLLSWTMRLDFIQRVFFCALVGLFAGLVSDVPLMIWFEAPLRYTLINFADHLCEWFLAGLAIAGFVPGREIWERLP